MKKCTLQEHLEQARAIGEQLGYTVNDNYTYTYIIDGKTYTAPCELLFTNESITKPINGVIHKVSYTYDEETQQFSCNMEEQQ